MSKTIPSCFGLGKPQTPDACQECNFRELCRKISEEFLPKAKLDPVVKKLENIVAALGGD
jgi:hypothetical protein